MTRKFVKTYNGELFLIIAQLLTGIAVAKGFDAASYFAFWGLIYLYIGSRLVFNYDSSRVMTGFVEGKDDTAKYDTVQVELKMQQERKNTFFDDSRKIKITFYGVVFVINAALTFLLLFAL